MSVEPEQQAIDEVEQANLLTNDGLSDELKIALLHQTFEREKFTKTQASERRRWWYSTPLAVALAGGITILLNFVFDSLRTDQQTLISAQTAATEFQYGILQQELEKDRTPQQRADVLLFLARSGLLDGLNTGYLIEVAQKEPASIPQLGKIDRATAGSLGAVHTVDDIIDVILRWEGGYVDHPSDVGGPFNMGVSRNLLSKWRGTSASIDDVRNLTLADARAYYRDLIKGIGADKVDNIFLRTVYVNAATHSGPTRAVRFLQRLIGEPEDGILGPKTILKVNNMSNENERDTVIRFNCSVLAYYKGLPSWEVFGSGWSNRLRDLTPGGDLKVCSAL